MLMHEWRKYRERQIRKVVREAREAEETQTQPTAAAPIGTTASEAVAPVSAEPERSPVEPLKSEPERPKQILDRLASTNVDIRERMEALRARQQVLPLDVEAAAPPPSRNGRAAESREQLVQRLLDPVLSLEEAATLLDVCPTTVRRYTNRGVLKCYRTPGNQRRFRLSEIMSFMERRQTSEE